MECSSCTVLALLCENQGHVNEGCPCHGVCHRVLGCSLWFRLTQPPDDTDNLEFLVYEKFTGQELTFDFWSLALLLPPKERLCLSGLHMSHSLESWAPF